MVEESYAVREGFFCTLQNTSHLIDHRSLRLLVLFHGGDPGLAVRRASHILTVHVAYELAHSVPTGEGKHWDNQRNGHE